MEFIDFQASVDFLIGVLTTVTPMAFLWAFASKALQWIVNAATGGSRNGKDF